MNTLAQRRGWLFVLLALLLSGCGRQGDTAAPPTPAASAAPTSAPTAAAATPATAAAAPTSAPAAPTPAADTFQNPVLRADFPDPGLLRVGDTFYAYATNAVGKNVQVARSSDLVTWETLPDALPALPRWAQLGGSLVWAPEVMQVGEQFVLYYTARDKASDRQCIGVAVSDKPEGRFKDGRDAPLVCQADEGGSIDPSPFRDGDALYLYWKNDGNCCAQPTYLYVQQLAPDGQSLVGEPARLVRNDAPWEGRLVEAPTMLKRAERYYLFFSANDYASDKYAVGYAACERPIGPCQDAPENPILRSRMDAQPLVVGPGHQTVLEIGDETWLAYHAWEVTSAGLRGSRRFLYLDQLGWEGDRPVVEGPTTGPQPRPAL
jgi:beta-xylosidase